MRYCLSCKMERVEMFPITNFAKDKFSEIQSRVSNSLLELIQTLYFVQQCESRQPLTEWLP